FSSRRRHTRFSRDWSSDVCSSDLSSTTYPAGLSTRYKAFLAWFMTSAGSRLPPSNGSSVAHDPGRTGSHGQSENGAPYPRGKPRDRKSVVEGKRGARRGRLVMIRS